MKHALAMLSVCAGGLAMEAGAASLTSDIVYGDKERNVLDLYLPDGNDNAPVVVFIHGGRWFRGDKTQIELYDRINSLTDAGIGIASINYTYTSEEIWPAQIDDVMNAIDFVAKNGATYGYDGSTLGVWGQSSGAHLALWAGLLAPDDPRFDLQAVASWYAPSDLYNITADRVDDDVPGENERFPEPSPESLLIGLPVPDNQAEADAASPTIYAANLPDGKELPDFQLTHGTADFVISPLQTQRFYDTLLEQGGAETVDLRWVIGGGHGGSLFDAETAPTTQFFAERLGTGPAPVPIPAGLPLLVASLAILGGIAKRRASNGS
jgi:acetyl esterase/lipase